MRKIRSSRKFTKKIAKFKFVFIFITYLKKILITVVKLRIVILLSALILAVFMMPRLLVVENIYCNSQYGECNEIYYEDLRKISGKSYIESKKQAINVLKDSLLVSDYNIRFSLPNSFVIDSLENKAKFSLYDGNRKVFLNVDNNGKIISKTESSNLPFVIVTKLYEEKFIVSDDQLFSLNLMYDVYNTIGIKQGILDEEGLKLTSKDGYHIILPVTGNRKLLIGSMLFLLGDVNKIDLPDENGEKIDTIDLRYKNPVIRY